MKRTLLLMACMLAALAMSAQEGLAVENIQNSGCLSQTRGEESEPIPTIVLTKEGSVLSVQLLNYDSNCATTDFNVTSIVNGGNDDVNGGNDDELYFVNISVVPRLPDGELPTCFCPYNVSFTLRDLEPNSFYFFCWWYNGYLELTEGEPYVMAIIDDIYYHLLPSINEAEVISHPRSYLGNNYTGNVVIPEKVVCNGSEYRVTSIKKSAFSGCKDLTSVTIPNSVTKIEETAFANCIGLTSVKIPNSVTSIGQFAFYLCSGLTSVTIPNSVTEIGDYAFQSCTSLTSITIPSSITSIGKHPFYDCSGLKSIAVEKGNPVYDSRESCKALIKTSDNEMISGCMNSTIPNSVTSIGSYAFYNCTRLNSIIIPNSVTKIGQAAFRNCKRLQSVKIPNSVVSVGQDAFSGCSGLTSITISNSLTSISGSVFASCSSLTSVTIPNSVTTIEGAAFINCGSLTSVTIPNTVTSIGGSAFASCKSLTSITIPNSVTSIGNGAFASCTGLTSIVIPNSVTSINESTFESCTGLTSVMIPNSVTFIDYDAFGRCSGLTSITIPNSVTEIGGYAFQYCSGITSVTFGSNIKSFGQWVFYGCNSLMDIYCYAEEVPNVQYNNIATNIEDITLHVPAASVSAYQAVEPWNNFKEIVALPDQALQNEYRPFIEEGKVWKVGSCISGNPVQLVEYYYFDGDTIIGGKVCKQMMSQRYVSPEYPNYDYLSQQPSLNYVGAWYEEDKKVYEYDTTDKQFRLMYDFSLEANGIFEINYPPYVFLYRIGPRQTGGIEGFKGVYRDVWEWEDGKIYKCAPWLEGVGIVYGSPTKNICNVGLEDPACFLMSCTVDDEVIYLIDGVEDGATPEGARKHRFDFTHTIKTKPQSRTRSEGDQSLYGEYNNQQLCINLNPLDETYLVSITSESGKTVYEKEINAGNIVALNIDISTYTEGRYTVTVENSSESFTGEFGVQTTGIKEISNKKEETGRKIYNLQGQRLSSLQKGLNIVNGQKIYVK